MSKSNMEIFSETYLTILESQIEANPTGYAYPLSHAPAVAVKMVAAYAAGTGCKGPALAKTCKALGIEYTFKAIKAYLAPTWCKVCKSTEHNARVLPAGTEGHAEPTLECPARVIRILPDFKTPGGCL